jgi:predicted nucleic acid-binding Zn ribbon protein
MMPCAVCGTPFEVRCKDHRFCAPKCRLAWFQQKPERARRERDAKLRLLVQTQRDTLDAIDFEVAALGESTVRDEWEAQCSSS